MANPVWNTPSGSIGTYPSLIAMSFQLDADPVLPAVSVTYTLLSGELPQGISLDEFGLISGSPFTISNDTSYEFVVRATDDLGNLRDRFFSITITGVNEPQFTIPTGSLFNTLDSTWVEFPILYSNPISANPVSIRIIQGSLPPGLEINEEGLIRGYAEPPTSTVSLESIDGFASISTSSNNSFTCFTTNGFTVGRPIVFAGSVFGGITAGETYYVKSILSETTFTISSTVNGPTYELSDDAGYMTFNLPTLSVGQAVIKSFSFTVKLTSPLGNDIESYYITVVNQNTPSTAGGPGFPANSRIPTIYNTRPASFDIANDSDYGYYVLPDSTLGLTYNPNTDAYIGQIYSDNYFAFKILGHDFDANALEYVFVDLPLGLTGDVNTGWITGTPTISENTISEYSFRVAVRKASFPSIITPVFNFSLKIANGINGEIIWLSDSDLGQIYNGAVSTKSIRATSDINLNYRIVSGDLPPNLSLLDNGEIVGVVAFQPTDTLLNLGDNTTFTFTVEAYNSNYPVISSTKTFTIDVLQEFSQPTDNLYMKCTPDIADRELIESLLTNTEIIPTDYLYRPDDGNFGKANSVVYMHAYGIYASDFDEYVAAVMKNHYNRQITLGPIETAVAKDENGNVIYEVVYSKIIDDLLNPQGISVSEEIYWPRPIDLSLGPWYTSVTDIYTSYISGPDIEFYTSLTPGYARLLYPNSLYNMRLRVGQELGQEFNFKLLPLWMTSQQANGSTLGFTPAWVICYTKPGFSEIIKNNIETEWVDFLGRPNKLNQINFQLDRFTVDKSTTYNYNKNLVPPAWTGLPSGTPAPDPIDSQDFYVLFPRKTILPNTTQY